MTRFEKIREKLYRIIQKKVESGDMAMAFEYGFSDPYDRCGCLLGCVAGYPDERRGNYLSGYSVAQGKLGITQTEANELEGGFENWTWRGDQNSPFYKLGEEIRKNFCEYSKEVAS